MKTIKYDIYSSFNERITNCDYNELKKYKSERDSVCVCVCLCVYVFV